MKSSSGLILASQIAALLYLLWRAGWTHDGANPVFFVLLLAVDMVVVIRHFVRTRARGGQRGELVETQPQTSYVASSPVILDVGQEPLVEVRTALRACMEVRGATSITVIDRLGRSDIEQLCQHFRVDRGVPDSTVKEAQIATEILESSGTELITVVPGSVWVPADIIELGVAALTEPHYSAVGMPATNRSPSSVGRFAGVAGYPLFAELSHPVPGATPGAVVLRADLVRKAGGFHTGNGDFVARTLDDINEGWAESISLGEGIVFRQPPWDEDQALRRRIDEVGRQQTAREAHRLLEAWSVVPRTFTLLLPAVIAVTGWLPFTTGIGEALVFGLPWFGLSALARAEMRAADTNHRRGPGETHWSDLRAGCRTITADFLGLVRGSSLAIPPGRIAARHLRVVGAIGLLALLGCFAQLVGFRLNELSDFATAMVVLASVGVLALVRDSTWAQADRERRVLPRSIPSHANELAVGLSPYGADIAETFSPGTELALRLALPQPGRNDWERNLTGVVHTTAPQSEAAGSYVQFDLDSETLDELLYFCAVTAPSLIRHGEVVPAGVMSVRKTGRERTVEPLRLSDTVTRPRGAFQENEAS